MIIPAKKNRPDFSRIIAFFYVLLVLACFGGGNPAYEIDAKQGDIAQLQSIDKDSPKGILSLSANLIDDTGLKTTSSRHFTGFSKIINHASNDFFSQSLRWQNAAYLSIKPLLLKKRRIVFSFPAKDKGDPSLA